VLRKKVASKAFEKLKNNFEPSYYQPFSSAPAAGDYQSDAIDFGHKKAARD
jgi:hypothetical protein